MNSLTASRFVFPIVCFLLPLTPLARGEELRWKFQPQQKFLVVLQAETNSQSTLNGKSLRTKFETKVETTWTVDEVQDGVASITQEVVRLSLTGTSVSGAGILYDSASAEKPIGAAKEIAQGVEHLIGAKVHCRMNSRGEILQADADKAIQKALTSDADESRPKIDDAWALELLQYPLCLLPGKEVQATETWTHERALSLPLGKLTQKETYSMVAPKTEEEDKDPSTVQIHCEAVLHPAANSPLNNLREQSQQGDFVFDREQGRLLHSEVVQKLTIANPYRDKEIVVKTQSVRRVEVTVP